MKVFVEQPLALPGSANYKTLVISLEKSSLRWRGDPSVWPLLRSTSYCDLLGQWEARNRGQRERELLVVESHFGKNFWLGLDTTLSDVSGFIPVFLQTSPRGNCGPHPHLFLTPKMDKQWKSPMVFWKK